MNKVMLTGRLTKDFKEINENFGVITVATNEYRKNDKGEKEQSAVFHQILTFGKTKEIAEKICKKGDLVTVEGRLSYSVKENEETETKEYRTHVIGNTITKWVSAKTENEQPETSEQPADMGKGYDDDIPW